MSMLTLNVTHMYEIEDSAAASWSLFQAIVPGGTDSVCEAMLVTIMPIGLNVNIAPRL